MFQHQLSPPPGAHKKRKRVGRGASRGNYSGRGIKGQKARSGPGPRPGFEGGQLPIIKRLPSKRGFTNIFKKEFSVVNLKQLEQFASGEEITPQRLREAGLIKDAQKLVKVLGDGELTKPLTVSAHSFSSSAREKLKAAGGKAQVLEHASSKRR